jgi:Zn-dependent metalloprotease
LGVNYDNVPVLERDVVAILDSLGHVTSVTVNLPMSNSRPVSSSINDRQVLEIVQNQLRTSAFTGTLSLSNTVTRGWIARGNKLYPVADVALLDPVRAKHFQVRIDLNAERTIGLSERTIH